MALGPATPLEQLPKISELAAAKEKRPEPPADACGRGSGRDPNGDCVPLGLKELEFVQRVQIPGGEFVMGALPGDYRGLPATGARGGGGDVVGAAAAARDAAELLD